MFNATFPSDTYIKTGHTFLNTCLLTSSYIVGKFGKREINRVCSVSTMSGNYWYVIVITIKRFIHNFSMELFEGIHTELLLGGLNLIYKFSLDQSNENDETANCSIHFQLVIYLIL